MDRTPEPELMTEDEQASAYAQADFAEPHENFVTLFKQTFPGITMQGSVLDLGCGPADVSIRFANHFPECSITGIDGSQAMLNYGVEAVKLADLEQRIQLLNVHLPFQQPPLESYQAIISNSLLHHLKNPMDLWQTVTNLGSAGTCIFVMDLMRPRSEQAARDLVETYASDEPEILQRDFYYSLLSSYTIDEVEDQLYKMGLIQFNVRPVSDRHMIIWSQL